MSLRTLGLSVVLASLAVVAVLALSAWSDPQAQQPPQGDKIDFAYAQQLIQKQKRGEELTPEEKDYLERAKKEYAKQHGVAQGGKGPGQGQPGNQDVPPPPPPRDKTGMIPLDQMTAQDKYKDQDGGLYGGGRNVPPEAHLKAALAAAAKVKPLDADGKPSPDGKIVLMSVGMSNTANEFGQYLRTPGADADRNPAVVVVNSAQGGMTANCWATADSRVWDVAAGKLKDAGVTSKQVQVIWLKGAQGGPAHLGDFPRHAQALKDFLAQNAQQILQHYPNVQLIYLSSRIYGGYALDSLNPEPYAYESAFAVRWLIQDQIKGEPKLNYDPAKGDVKSPVLLWGPYLWADGVTPRKSDGLTYLKEDLAGDGTHPSPLGGAKVVKLLVNFFKTDPTAKPWYLKGNAAAK